LIRSSSFVASFAVGARPIIFFGTLHAVFASSACASTKSPSNQTIPAPIRAKISAPALKIRR
jgi:hypothetical protein